MRTLTLASPYLSKISLGNMALDISTGYIVDLGLLLDSSGGLLLKHH